MARRKRTKIGINTLGDLEVDVMSVIWKLKKARVKDVFEILYERRRLAYTTIMTVMNRLAVKGILEQDKSSIPYVYTPKVDKKEMAASMVGEVIDRVLDGSPETIVSYLLKRGKIGAQEIKKLKALVKAKK